MKTLASVLSALAVTAIAGSAFAAAIPASDWTIKSFSQSTESGEGSEEEKKPAGEGGGGE